MAFIDTQSYAINMYSIPGLAEDTYDDSMMTSIWFSSCLINTTKMKMISNDFVTQLYQEDSWGFLGTGGTECHSLGSKRAKP